MQKYVIDYNNGNILILETEATVEQFEELIGICRKDMMSPYEKLLDLLKQNGFKHRVIIDTYDLPFYEV